MEGGYVTNKDKLPISAVVTGGADADSDGSYFVGPVGCAPQPFSGWPLPMYSPLFQLITTVTIVLIG